MRFFFVKFLENGSELGFSCLNLCGYCMYFDGFKEVMWMRVWFRIKEKY